MAAQRKQPTTADVNRKWASGRELNSIEQLAFAYRVYRTQLDASGIFRILPVAVDANVLLNALAREALAKPSEFLEAVRLGVIRVYVGETIPSEVERNVVERARRAGAPEDELMRIWRNDVLPRLRVVETGTVEHPRLATILDRHQADRPTAVLSLFIGARLTWSTDRDLRDSGYAERLNVEVIVAAQKVGSFELSAHLALNISSNTLEAGGRAVMRAIERPGPERTVALVAVVLIAGVLTVALVKDAERTKDTVRRIAVGGLEALQAICAERLRAGATMTSTERRDLSEPLAVRLAHLLAVAPAPMTVAEMSDVLVTVGMPAEAREVEVALRECRMFVHGRYGWQLGNW